MNLTTKNREMMKEFLCEICNQPMKLIKTVGTKQSGKMYRQRWFYCSLCDYTKKIYADGQRDEEYEPVAALKDLERQIKKEVDARTKF